MGKGILQIKRMNNDYTESKYSLLETIWYSEPISSFRNFYNSVKRILRWFPIVWNQRDWDYEGIYSLLEQKMKDLREEINRDKWHDSTDINKSLKQIEICMTRMDRYRNWTDYYEYPMDDIEFAESGEGLFPIKYTSESNEQQRLGAIDFEEKNFKKFWKDFTEWHRNWWT